MAGVLLGRLISGERLPCAMKGLASKIEIETLCTSGGVSSDINRGGIVYRHVIFATAIILVTDVPFAATRSQE